MTKALGFQPPLHGGGGCVRTARRVRSLRSFLSEVLRTADLALPARKATDQVVLSRTIFQQIQLKKRRKTYEAG